MALQLRAAVCGDVPNVMLAGRAQERPVGFEADTDSVTVPDNPFSAVTIIVEVPVVRALTVIPLMLEVMLKSVTVTVIVVD